MIKIIKKKDIVRQLFDDPEQARIERHVKTLNHLIDEQPERYHRICELLRVPKNVLSVDK